MHKCSCQKVFLHKYILSFYCTLGKICKVQQSTGCKHGIPSNWSFITCLLKVLSSISQVIKDKVLYNVSYTNLPSVRNKNLFSNKVKQDGQSTESKITFYLPMQCVQEKNMPFFKQFNSFDSVKFSVHTE